jgi:hypothetical protein
MKVALLSTTALALAAIAVVAFALPAAADVEGPYWYDHMDDRAPTEADPKKVEPKASLTFTVGPLTVTCVGLETKGTLWNSEETGMGEAVIEEGTGISCSTNLAGCEVEGTPVFPWTVTATELLFVEVSNIKVENHFSKGCEKYGLSAKTTMSGTATGAFDGLLSAIVFDEDGDLKSDPGGLTVKLHGQVKFGTEVTVEF